MQQSAERKETCCMKCSPARRFLQGGMAAATALIALLLPASIPRAGSGALASSLTYTNPLVATVTGTGRVETCGAPSIIRGQTPGDNSWYIYCTTDPLNDQDRDA